ncbi:hypothetical protein SAMN06297251_12728 [Fulvimarina manganoxydans]|uniref:Uncharacterized protein n=1 Tax=Fulvimarina manganoxydans TaxID=937218 RepID=A0A1W2EK02_9HYPH|nr:hypothetical protein [Fulvimarina manganoxydans]SMD10040.1 hypothetical protein SAMN06297251_12728 [Fulvimarina manganoxydans]
MSDETSSSPIVGFRTLLTKTVDGVLSEKVLFSFFENGDVDPARPQQTVVGRLKLAPARSVNPAARNTMNWQIEMTAGTAELAISMLDYPDLVVKERDMVKPLERPGAKWWSVASADPRGGARLVIQLVQE